MASARETSRSSGSSDRRALQRRALAAASAGFVVCVDAGEHVDLEVRRIYRVMPDPDGARHGLVRVIDESGEDYLYPVDRFVPLVLPVRTAKIVRQLV